MNPRYLAYCRAHGKTPEEMRVQDAEDFPGGKMCGFILWINGKVSEFAKKHGAQARYGPGTGQLPWKNPGAFDAQKRGFRGYPRGIH